jgi:hypothetical protein
MASPAPPVLPEIFLFAYEKRISGKRLALFFLSTEWAFTG